MLLSQSKPENDDDLNPSLFNLVDLILNSIRSPNPQTTIAALKLVTVILSKNHHYALGTLLRVVMVHLKDPQRTTGALNVEAENYLDIAGDIGGDDGLDEAYETHLKDMIHTIETHPCSSRALAFSDPGIPSNAPFADRIPSGGPSRVDTHHLNANDPLLTSLIGLLTTFFTNNVETNLALTETLVVLASCFHLRLEGWFTVEPSSYTYPTSLTAPSSPTHTRAPSLSASHPSLANLASSTSNLPSEIQDDPLRALALCARMPSWSDAHTPALLRALENLRDVTAQLRSHIPHFDTLVQNRKQAFRVHDEIEEAMNAPPPLMAPSTPQRNAGLSPARGGPRSGVASPAASNMSRQPSDTGPGGHTPPRNPVARVMRGEVGSPSPAPRTMSPSTRGRHGATMAPATPAGRKTTGRSTLSPGDEAGPYTPGPRRSGRRKLSGEVASIGRRIRFRVSGGRIELMVEREESDDEEGAAANGENKNKPLPAPPSEETKQEEPQNKSEQPSTPASKTAKPKPSPKSDSKPGAKPKARSPAPAAGKTKAKKESKESEKNASSAVVDDEEEPEEQEIIHDCSLSHLLTNVVVLQEFVLELVALMQARATLFADREVRFT
jgi:hypothetical protein